MSDIMNLVEKIPYAIMLLFGVAIILQIYITGNLSIALSIDETQKDDYRKAIVLENFLSVDATETELESTSTAYSYPRRRAKIPIEFFTNQNPEDDEIGYKETNSGHCYIEKVQGLDGENFAYYVQPDYSLTQNAEDPRSLACSRQGSSYQTVYSEALLVREARENPLLPVKVHVYEVP